MGLGFEELDWQRTELGEYTLRRRFESIVGRDVYEVKLGDEFLMSSLFTVAEIELARRALARLDRSGLRVLVGGLGLGYTAHEALADPRVAHVTVLEAAPPVLDWHRRGLFADTAGLATDPRCDLVEGDFFEFVGGGGGQEASYDAILLDIDHSPRHVLHPRHTAFYAADGLRTMTRRLTEDGIFALWSDDAPDADFQDVLSGVFVDATADVVSFANPITGGESRNTVYLATGVRGGRGTPAVR